MVIDYDVILKRINITHSSQERRIDGYMECKGNAIALVNDDEEIEFTFEYKGKPSESTSLIEQYLKKEANRIYREKRLKNRSTLADFIRQHIKD